MDPFLNIAIADIVDIAFVTVLLYIAIAWGQRTRAAFVVRGMLILGAVYIMARQLDLRLTAWVFQGFFAILLIIIVVIFQEELRQIFERIAVWGMRSKANPALWSETTDILVRTSADLVHGRIGALIVVRGHDPLERHITGGIPLDGKLSGPLLRSIFDPHSPGHDGAVVVENWKVSRFAALLPLSKDLEQLTNVGTRHSAALGLAELTDSLCIVVSEERGKISVARDGRLKELNSPQELVGLLEKFLQEKYPSQKRHRISVQLLRENWQGKVVALTLAIGFWYVFVPGSKIVEATYRVPVEIQNLSPDFELESVQPPEIEATFSGPRRAFYLFQPRKLKVTVDASLAELGRRTFNISEQNIHHPKELNFQDLSPSTVKISVKKVRRVTEDNRG